LPSGKGERVAIEIETGKSNIKKNIIKTRAAGFDRVFLVATSPQAIKACQRAMSEASTVDGPEPEMLTWLDVS
jgi:hypothetical protein